MRWAVLFSDEVRTWYVGLSPSSKAATDRIIERLATYGYMLRMPHAKPLGDGLHELRFVAADGARRITYVVDPEHQAVTLSTFRKQRINERAEILRARRAQSTHEKTRAAEKHEAMKKGRNKP